MKAKTFILTFLMMMSSPFLFGQHWTDPGELYQPGTMQFTSKIYLDNELQTNTSYEIAVFNGTTLLEVANIVAIGSGENTLYHVDLNVQGTDGMGDIYFKLYNGEKEFVSVENYITEIKRMNGLSSDVLYAGNYLLIPQFIIE